MTNPNDALREALAFYADDANWRQNGPLDPNSANFTGGPARAALAAAPQPATAPAADERAAMIEVIVQADDAYDRVQGGTWAGAIADALLAAGYRKADALLAERDALIHDIERAKESESALLAELEQARGIVRQGSRVNSDWFQRRDHMAPSRHSKKPGSCTFGPSTS